MKYVLAGLSGCELDLLRREDVGEIDHATVDPTPLLSTLCNVFGIIVVIVVIIVVIMVVIIVVSSSDRIIVVIGSQ